MSSSIFYFVLDAFKATLLKGFITIIRQIAFIIWGSWKQFVFLAWMFCFPWQYNNAIVWEGWFEQFCTEFMVSLRWELRVRSRFHVGYVRYLLFKSLELHQIGLLKHFGFLEAFRSFVYVPSKERGCPDCSNRSGSSQISG